MVSLSDNNQAAVIEAFDSASRPRQSQGQIKIHVFGVTQPYLNLLVKSRFF